MDRVGITEFRKDALRFVERARAGERVVITVNGIEAAEIGPLETRAGPMTVDERDATDRDIVNELRDDRF